MSFASAVTQLSLPLLPLATLVRLAVLLPLLTLVLLFFRPLLSGLLRALMLTLRPRPRKAAPAEGALGA